jgi:hypothetical protein
LVAIAPLASATTTMPEVNVTARQNSPRCAMRSSCRAARAEARAPAQERDLSSVRGPVQGSVPLGSSWTPAEPG